MHASTFWGLDGRPTVLSIPSLPRFLSLGSVDPAPHTQHLLGPFEAIAQNSLLRSFSIVDSLANRQHSCRGSEELAIRFQATPNYFAALRATPSGGRPRTPSYSELLQAIPSYSEPLRAATRALRALQAATYNYLSFHNSIYRRPPSHSALLRARGAQELRATPSHSERLLRATRALRARIDFAGLPSYSELLRVRGAQEPRATPSCSQKLRALRASWSCKLGKGCLKR